MTRLLILLTPTLLAACTAAAPRSAAPTTWSYAVLAIPHLGQSLPAIWRTPTEIIERTATPAHPPAEPAYSAAAPLYRTLAHTDPPPDFIAELQLFNLLGKQGWQLTTLEPNTAYANYWFKKPN